MTAIRELSLAVLTAVLLLGLCGAAVGQKKDDKRGRDLKTNARERVAAAQAMYKGLLARWKKGPGLYKPAPGDFAEKLYRWSSRWMQAQTDAASKDADRIAAAQDHLDRMSEMDRIARVQLKSKVITVLEVTAVEFFRLEAEKHLLRLKKKK